MQTINPHQEQKVQIFGVTNYNEYWESRKKRNRTYETDIHRILIELVKKYTPKEGVVLDLGVGPGHIFRELQKSFDMHGVEISDEAYTLYDFPSQNIKQYDLQKGIPKLPASPFNTIVASHIIHHMREPISFIDQAANELSPGGIFIIATQNISFITYRLKYFFHGEFPRVSFGHVNFISPYEYKTIIKDRGFSIEEIRTTRSHTFLNKLFPFWFSGTLFFVCRKA